MIDWSHKQQSEQIKQTAERSLLMVSSGKPARLISNAHFKNIDRFIF